MNPPVSLRKRQRANLKSGLYTLKKAVAVLGSRALPSDLPPAGGSPRAAGRPALRTSPPPSRVPRLGRQRRPVQEDAEGRGTPVTLCALLSAPHVRVDPPLARHGRRVLARPPAGPCRHVRMTTAIYGGRLPTRRSEALDRLDAVLGTAMQPDATATTEKTA